MKFIKYEIRNYTTKEALKRSLLAFISIFIIGFLIIIFLFNLYYKPVKSVFKDIELSPTLLKYPQRPKEYSKLLPTLDNVALVKVQTTYGGIYYTLVSDSTPEKTVNMVLEAFSKENWSNVTVNAQTSLLGSFKKDGKIAGVEITSKKRDYSINGWVTITILLENESLLPIDPLINKEENKETKDSIS
jgi:hypothetical protein